jgi:hypothetical protein
MDGATLECEGPEFTDSDLAAAEGLEELESISLMDTAVTDDGFRSLLRARSLVEVAIESDTLSGDSLRVLAQLPELRSIQFFRGPNIDDSGLKYLSGCSELCELYLMQTAVTDGGLSYIEKLPRLWSLMLDGSNVTDEGCRAIARLPELTLLGLGHTRVSGHGLADFGADRPLNVYLHETPATDEGVIEVATRLSNLKLISLNDTAVGDAAARALSKLPALDVVQLSRTR